MVRCVAARRGRRGSGLLDRHTYYHTGRWMKLSVLSWTSMYSPSSIHFMHSTRTCIFATFRTFDVVFSLQHTCSTVFHVLHLPSQQYSRIAVGWYHTTGSCLHIIHMLCCAMWKAGRRCRFRTLDTHPLRLSIYILQMGAHVGFPVSPFFPSFFLAGGSVPCGGAYRVRLPGGRGGRGGAEG
jgi:hypothetical protein